MTRQPLSATNLPAPQVAHESLERRLFLSGGASNLFARMAGDGPLLDPRACSAHAERGEKQLAERLVRETPFIP